MAYKTLTVQTLVNRVKFHILGVGQTDTSLDTEILWALNSRLQDMIGRTEYPAFRVEAHIVTRSGVEDYWLPDDFDRIIEPSVRFVDSPFWTLRYLDEQDFDVIHGRDAYQARQKPMWFNVRWRDKDSGLFTLRLHPTPDLNYDLAYAYFSLPTRLDTAALTDTFEPRFPPQYHESLAYGAAAMFPQYISRDQIEAFIGYYERAISEMMQAVRPVTGRVYQNKAHMERRGSGTYVADLSAPEQ